MPDSNYQTLKYSVNQQIAKIKLDCPPANLINREMTLDFHHALLRAESDPEVRVIILSGAGRGLSGGVDLKYIEKFNSDEMREFLELFYVRTMEITRALSKPIIAAVHGYAREGACTLAFSCDMIIATDDSDFGYPGVPNLAAPPGMHVWFLQKILGRMKAAELIFTGEILKANQAEEMGLVTKVVPSSKLTMATEELARKIIMMSPLAIKRTKELLYKMEDLDFAAVPEEAAEALSSAFSSNDSKEARKAFLEKRKPVWTGT